MGSPAPSIDRDLPCRGCGYNLRGLGAIGDCPECGRAILRTLLDDPITPSAWLRTLSGGALLISAAMLLGGATAAAGLFVSRGPWVFVAFALAAATGAIGTWAFASPPPRSAPTTFPRRWTSSGVAL